MPSVLRERRQFPTCLECDERERLLLVVFCLIKSYRNRPGTLGGHFPLTSWLVNHFPKPKTAHFARRFGRRYEPSWRESKDKEKKEKKKKGKGNDKKKK